MSRIPGASGETPRVNPYFWEDVSGPQPITLGAEEFVTGLTSLLQHIDARDHPHVLGLFTALAHGDLDCRVDENAAFSALIQHEEYDAFGEVFDAYHQLLEARTHARPAWDGAPFKRSLFLRLPPGWCYRFEAELQTALERARVQRVTVSSTEPAGVLSDGMCDCMATLLRFGLEELDVRSPVASPEKLVDAFKNGALKSASFLASRKNMGQAHWTSYERMVAGLAGCKSITTLGFDFTPQQLHALTPVFKKCLDSAVFAPQEIRVFSDRFSGQASIEQVKSFMGVVSTCKTLGTFKMDTVDLDVDGFSQAFVQPLKGHPTLHTLQVHRIADGPFTLASVTVLPLLVSLGATCPSLKRVAWTGGQRIDVTGQAMRDFLLANGSGIDFKKIAADMVKQLALPTFALEFLELNNLPFPPEVLRAFFQALAHNASLRAFALPGCLVELRSVLGLLVALETNASLAKIVMPEHVGHYFLLDPNRLIQGLATAMASSDKKLKEQVRAFFNACQAYFADSAMGEPGKTVLARVEGVLAAFLRPAHKATTVASDGADSASEEGSVSATDSTPVTASDLAPASASSMEADSNPAPDLAEGDDAGEGPD